ncbi:peptide deformylase [Candidatus Parcubacteria bacterium]|jgi:peptide deformylase|nr:MAG: peptide deformylase [Candidatus Parcubacteria bacterium]
MNQKEVKPIVTIEEKKNETFLRKKTVPFNFDNYTEKELRELIKMMRETMKRANGVGLSANQVGLRERFFVAEAPDSQGRQKFYAVFNPKITKFSEELSTVEEGCLSVPEMFGPTPRAYRVTLEGQDIKGKKIKIKAWGLLARIFQHEVDHLDGHLFIDRTKSARKIQIKK